MTQGYPPRGYPATPAQRGMVPVGVGRQARHAVRAPLPNLGDTRTPLDKFLESPEMQTFTAVVAKYVIQSTLGPEPGDNVRSQTQLRPEPFVLETITWATDGDLNLPNDSASLFPFSSWSQQGRAIEVRWGDSFTTFLGTNASLLSALFGDSNGFLDLPGIALFQGSQNLSVTLNRLFWPFEVGEEQFNNPRNIRIDFTFHGVGLLPKGVNQSGAVG